MNEETISTTDLLLAATLKSAGHEVRQLTKKVKGPRTDYVFEFDCTPEAMTVKADFFAGKILVEPHVFIAIYKTLKRMVYERMQEIKEGQ